MTLSAENRALVEREIPDASIYTNIYKKEQFGAGTDELNRLLDVARAEGSASPPPPAEGVGKEEHGSSCTDLSCAQTHTMAPSPAGVPAWREVIALFRRHRLPPPPVRLRDELVTWLVDHRKLGGSR